MWAKISSALKSRSSHEDDNNTGSQGEVLTKVFEQHPNLSLFHQNDRPVATPSPPPSPTRATRKSMFKRSIRMTKDDDDSIRAPSPMLKRPQTLPKKMMSHFNLQGNSSQTSLLRGSVDLKEIPKHSPTESNARRHVQEIFSRPSAGPSAPELLPPQLPPFPESAESLLHPLSGTPGFDPRLGSVRSILRHPNTPGTGQNVRFFSRDAYKTISPDTSSSMEPDYQPLSPMEFNKDGSNQDNELLPSFFGGSGPTSGPVGSSTPAGAVVSRSASSSSSSNRSRPSLSEVFLPLHSDEGNVSPDTSRSLDGFGEPPIPAPDFSGNLFDVPEYMDHPSLPPGLGGDVDADVGERDKNDVDQAFGAVPHSAPAHMTSMLLNPQDGGKGKEKAFVESKELPLLPVEIRSKESPPRLLNLLHDRSQSFSFGQTAFFSANNNPKTSPKGSPNPVRGSPLLADTKPTPSELDSPLRPSLSIRSNRARSRALSDTVFHSRAMSPTGQPPEADINDESSPELFPPPQPAEPDPFSAYAKTYYTPQTMIPTTPPQKQHVRTASKEDSIIFSLQTQLALQTELCGQYETDLRSRDEMVEMLNNKIAEMDKEETRKKNVLRTWKKKVQEMEKAVRHLEEELEGSRQESMERSVMDEASGEALRMLHRQIANLERERGEWTKKEKSFMDEVEALEGLVKEKDGDVTQLTEVLRKRDESERALQEGIREAKEQIEMMGNVSIGYVDEEELRRLAAEREQRQTVEVERRRAAETHWEQEKTELSMRLENAELDKESMVEQLETLREQMKARDEEYAVLKAEVEAQWQHTEHASERIEALENEKIRLENEKESLKRELTLLEEKAVSLELEWQESENRKNEMENELQEVWNEKEALEKERDELEEQLRQEGDQVDELTNELQDRQDRIVELDQESQFAADNVSRLEDNLRRRDQELAEYSAHVVQREAEVEKLREELSSQRRGQSRELEERTRRVQEAIEEAAEARAQLEGSVRIKAELEVENKTNRDRVGALKEEVERLRRQVHSLQQDSADKEVKVVQITKQLAQKEEDITGLNIALDSKQQELELMKRKQGVRGTAGSTPVQPSKVHHRRDSSVLDGTPTLSRPPSTTSDASGRESVLGKQRKLSSESVLTSSAIKISTLGKSARVNGAMGPPATSKPRASISTPTPISRVSSVSSQASSGGKSTPLTQRRLSTTAFDRAQTGAKRTGTAPAASRGSPSNSSMASVSETEEKENVGRRIPVPA